MRARCIRCFVLSVTATGLIAALGCAGEVAKPTEPHLDPATIKKLGMTEAGARAVLNKLILTPEADPEDGPAPLTVKFSVGTDEEVASPKYTWDFGDGSPQSTEATPTHTFARPGMYTVVVTVRDASSEKFGRDDLLVDVGDPNE